LLLRVRQKSQEDMAKHWRLHPHDQGRIAALAQATLISPIVAQLLICRGLDQVQQVRDFLDTKLSQLRDPGELPGASAAAQRIHAAVQARQRIIVYGDYDVDGITGTSLLLQCLRMLGADVGYYIPHRLDEGYGLNHEAIRTLATHGAKQIITVDCGISSVDEALTVKELGVELIITDHHSLAASLPEAAAIVHPQLPGHAYPFAGLSGSGVALKVAWALCQQASGAKKVGERMKNFLMSAVGLAALGTVADAVPLVDENRVLVQYGLRSMKDMPSLGLATLMRITEVDRKAALDCDDLGFMLAPRLNAAGRLGQAQLAVELLTTDDAERATALAEYINELNSSRQSLERSIYLAANKQATEDFDAEQDAALVLADHDWHQGVIGIVAGRLAEKFHRPVILIALDKLGVKPGVGSARSVPGFNLHEALSACGHHLLSHGGHAAAAGLRIEESKLEDFRADFCEHAASEIPHAERIAELWIDAEAPLSLLTLETVLQIERLAPFGQANRRPLFCATGVTLDETPKKIGGGQRHLSLKLSQHGVGLRAIAFGGADWYEDLCQHEGSLDIVFRPMINHFRGRRSVELQITDWRVSEAVPAASS
jgi:single-stranded-DNA-specific exonuclease